MPTAWRRSLPTSRWRSSGATRRPARWRPPGFLWPELGTIDPGQPKSERLAQLARLVTHADNGRFARTIVNRIWHRLMGRGIVQPVDVMANEPWSEDLLDELAGDFVDHGYDLKRLIAVIIALAGLPVAGVSARGGGVGATTTSSGARR